MKSQVRRRWIKEVAGRWIQPVKKNYKQQCCDCGLVHTYEFRVYRGHIQYRVWRDNRATAQIRRHKK